MKKLVPVPSIPLDILTWIERISERMLDGIVIVDENFTIRFASKYLTSDFSLNGVSLVGTNYFATFFGLDFQRPAHKKRAARTPLHKALCLNEFTKEPPYKIVPARNGKSYQVKPWPATCDHESSKIRLVLEFWRRIGRVELFKDNPSFIKV